MCPSQTSRGLNASESAVAEKNAWANEWIMIFYKRKKENQIKSVYIQFLLIEKLHLLAEGVCVRARERYSFSSFLIITSSSTKMSAETCFPSQLIQNILLCICSHLAISKTNYLLIKGD